MKPSKNFVKCLILILVKLSARLMYRVRYNGTKGIPRQGAAVLVSNHVSYVDWLIIASGCRRPVHFVMHSSIYKKKLFRWFFSLNGVIPIDSGRNNPVVLHRAFSSIDSILSAGGLVCIFPEGHLTRTGSIDRFRPGIETILQRSPVPVVPLALHGLWGSFFSRKNGKAMRKWSGRFRARIVLAAGPALHPREATAGSLRGAVEALYNSALQEA